MAAVELRVKKGRPAPLGVNVDSQGVNFALFARHAISVTLCLFYPDSGKLYAQITLDPETHKTGDIWHVYIPELPQTFNYAYKVAGPEEGKKFFDYNGSVLLLDPYAKSVNTPVEWGVNSQAQKHYQPLGEIPVPRSWEEEKRPFIPMQDLIIYEMHVRGFTQHPSSEAGNRGTFLGVIEKIPHLLELGVNAVELLPVHEFDEMEWKHLNPASKERLYQYWGYSTVNFFSLMNRYASAPGSAIEDFRKMVAALHKAGIEVILDVVFNHTAEGSKKKGPTLSFRGIDNPIYYMTTSTDYLDFTGCGNTVNCNHPVVISFIRECLRYWVLEMHVDGFRFDLASIFSRGQDGSPIRNAPLIEEIAQDPILRNVKLISEPWDAAGLYQVGSFYTQNSRWSEWNGKYRDSIRRFIKGTGRKGDFATRICGSEDLYKGRSPLCSINFVTCHDGFTLHDLVTFNEKHNKANGENNIDGLNENDSWNCGIEGETHNAKINKIRAQQMRNFHLALMISQGVPMLFMGDEYGHTKLGNNNTWCQDNDLNWFLWDDLKLNAGFFRFYKMMIQMRKQNPIFRHSDFLKSKDIEWHGQNPFEPEWDTPKQFLAFTLKDALTGGDIYVAFNATNMETTVVIPESPSRKLWHTIVDTSQPSPNDIVEEKDAVLLSSNSIKMAPFSAVLLKAL